MIKFIKRSNLQELDNIVSKMEIDNKISTKIKKYLTRIGKRDIEDYKYGSNWIDKWCINRDIAKINRILKPFSIVVV